MKNLPEKMVITAIILSCGFVLGSEPAAQPAKAKHASGAHTWETPHTAAAHTHTAKTASVLAVNW